MIIEGMQRAFYQKFVTYDGDWATNLEYDIAPTEFDLSDFGVAVHNHYSFLDDICDPVVNIPILDEVREQKSSTVWSNGYEHISIQGANDDLFFTILRNQIDKYPNKVAAAQCSANSMGMNPNWDDAPTK